MSPRSHRENGTAQIALRELTLGRYWACLIALGVEEGAEPEFQKDRIALFLDEILAAPVDFVSPDVAEQTARAAWASIITQVNTAGMLAAERADIVMDEIAHEPASSGTMSLDRLMCQFEPQQLAPLLEMPFVQAMAWLRGRSATESLKEMKRKYKARMN